MQLGQIRICLKNILYMYICIYVYAHTYSKTYTYIHTQSIHIYVLMLGPWLAQSSRAQGPCKQCTAELRAHCLFSCVQVQWCPPVQSFLFLSSKYWTWSRPGKGKVKNPSENTGSSALPQRCSLFYGGSQLEQQGGRTARFGQGAVSIIRICLCYCVCFQGRNQLLVWVKSQQHRLSTLWFCSFIHSISSFIFFSSKFSWILRTTLSSVSANPMSGTIHPSLPSFTDDIEDGVKLKHRSPWQQIKDQARYQAFTKCWIWLLFSLVIFYY